MYSKVCSYIHKEEGLIKNENKFCTVRLEKLL